MATPTTTPPGRMPPYMISHQTYGFISSELQYAVTTILENRLDISTALDSFKSSLNAQYQNNTFFNQDLTQDAHYKAMHPSVVQLKQLTPLHFLYNRNAALTLFNNIEEKKQTFFREQKKKFERDLADVTLEEREQLWLKYKEQLESSFFQPILDFSNATNSNHLYQSAMAYFVQQGMGQAQPYADVQTGPRDKVDFKRESQYMDSHGLPITVKYDKEGNATNINIRPKGKIADATAIMLASYNGTEKMPPIRIAFPISKSDLLVSHMEPGFTLLILIAMFSFAARLQQRGHTKKAIQAAIEQGFDLKFLQLENKDGTPIPFSQEELEKVKLAQETFLQQAADIMKEFVVPDSEQQAAEPTMSPRLTR